MKIVVITGASGGIGFEFAKQYKEKGFHVIGLVRTATPDLRKLDIEIVENFDVTKEDDIQKFKKKMMGKLIDLLINNAGILRSNSLDNLDVESIREQMEVNAYGPLRLTAALQDNLKKGSTVAMVTSRMGSITDNTSGGYYGYRMSKAALNMAAMSLSRDLSQGVTVITLHPGYVRTHMTGGGGEINPDESVKGMIKQIEKIKPGSPLRFMHTNGNELPW